jgi:hypothetical protein
MSHTGSGSTIPAIDTTISCGSNINISANPAAHWHFMRWISSTEMFDITDPTDPTTTISIPCP